MKTMLDEEELQKLIFAFSQGHDAPITEDDTTKVIRWAEQAQVDYSLLQNVLAGDVLIDVREDGEIVFKISDQGREVVEKFALPSMADTDKIIQ